MFPPQSFEEISDVMDKAGVCCNPNLDLLPDGHFISCYPLHQLHQISLNTETTAAHLIDSFNHYRDKVREIGIFPYCGDCPLFKVRCNGGCTAFKLNRLKNRQNRTKFSDEFYQIFTPTMFKLEWFDSLHTIRYDDQLTN